MALAQQPGTKLAIRSCHEALPLPVEPRLYIPAPLRPDCRCTVYRACQRLRVLRLFSKYARWGGIATKPIRYVVMIGWSAAFFAGRAFRSRRQWYKCQPAVQLAKITMRRTLHAQNTKLSVF